jgi:SAM-dependent methyltransferase
MSIILIKFYRNGESARISPNFFIMKTSEYAASFDLFLAATNEKRVLAEAVTSAVQLNGDESLLDIGAGDGTLSAHLRPHTSRYVAVEMDRQLSNRLRGQGLEVVEGAYPAVDPIVEPDLFDVVLSSYSSPIEQKAMQEFVASAWRRVRAGGFLSLVTFGEGDDWTKIADEIEQVAPFAELRGYPLESTELASRANSLQLICSGLGPVERRTPVSQLKARSHAELFYAAGFLATAGIEKALDMYSQAREDILRILSHYDPPVIEQRHTLITVERLPGE